MRFRTILAALGAGVLLVACNGDSSVASGDSSVASGESSVAAEEPGVATTASSDIEVHATLDESNPLRGTVGFSSADGAAPTIDITDENGNGFRLTPPVNESGSYEVPLLGLAPDTTYEVRLVTDGATGTTTVEVPDLPDEFPPVEVTVDGEPAGGMTIFNVTPINPAGVEGPTGDSYMMAVDSRGEVVWYEALTHSVQDLRRTHSGDLLYIHHETGVRLLDPADGSMTEYSGTTGLETATTDTEGRPYAGPDAIPVDTDQMHHEIIESPSGNLITLSRVLETVDGFPEPICDEDEGEGEFDGSYEVAADTIVEFEPGTGAVVFEWSLLDMASPLDDLERIRPAEFCGQYLNPVYPDMSARDWTHSNAVVLDEQRNALWVSVRHLDQLFAVRYQDDESGPAGEILWKLGENGDFDLEEGEWFLHPHAPEIQDDGTIMVYDNGNERAGTSLDDPDNLPYSRAVQYELDTEALTAQQVWENRLDRPGEAVYAPFVGDADVVDGDTVLVTHGGLLDPPAHSPQAEGTAAWARITEVDYETQEVLFDLTVKDDAGEMGWIIYRAERIDHLYPADYTVEYLSP